MAGAVVDQAAGRAGCVIHGAGKVQERALTWRAAREPE